MLSADPATDSLMIGIQNNKVVRLPLMECVKKTLEINAAISQAIMTRPCNCAVAVLGPRSRFCAR